MGVLVAILGTHFHHLRISGSFHDADMLALSEVLIPYANTLLLSHVKRLDFGRASLEGKLHGVKGFFNSHGAFAASVASYSHRNIFQKCSSKGIVDLMFPLVFLCKPKP
jgi:hypothetical protein